MVSQTSKYDLPLSAFNASESAQMECLLVDLRHLYHERNQALVKVSRAHHDALYRLARAAELRDDDTGIHIVRLGFIAEQLARLLNCEEPWARMLRLAAPMHDIGKIGIPDSVLKKPGALTPSERAIMNRHPAMGSEILARSGIALFDFAAEVALSHHERWNGTGYPSGLAGEAIPLSGRIVAVVDFFDAVTMDRCYRPAFSDTEALRMLGEERGRAFDPDIVDVFTRHADQLIATRDRVNHGQFSFKDLVGPGADGLLFESAGP